MSYDYFLDVEHERYYQDDVCGCGDMFDCEECRSEVTIVFEAFRSTKRTARKDHKVREGEVRILKGQSYSDHYSRVVWIDDDGDRHSDIYIKKTLIGEKK